MTTPELTTAERLKVAAFGLDTPDGAEAAKIVALIENDIARHPNPMNGDGRNYALGELRKSILRRYPAAAVEVPPDPRPTIPDTSADDA